MRKLALLLVFALLASIAVPTYAQTDDDDYQADLDAIVESYVENDNAIAVQVTSPDGTWTAAAGMSFEGQPTTADARFRIASMSKTYVATLTLLLVEEGYFGLDDLASDYLPEDVVANVANADEVTLRQLLAMRSGIPDYLGTDEFWNAVYENPTYAWTAEEAITYAYGLPALFAPDEAFDYSNSNYILMQLVIESATGQPLHEVMREYIIDPLGLEDTYTQVYEGAEGLVESRYDFDEDGTEDNVSEVNDGAGLGDGSLISTVADVTTFYQALLVDESLLAEESYAELYTFLPDDSGEADYSLGLDRWDTEAYGYALGHTGGVVGFASIGLYLPDEDLIIVVLAANEELDIESIALEIAELFIEE